MVSTLETRFGIGSKVKEILFGKTIPSQPILHFDPPAEFLEKYPKFGKFIGAEVSFSQPNIANGLVLQWQEQTKGKVYQHSAIKVWITNEEEKEDRLTIVQKGYPRNKFFIGPDFTEVRVSSQEEDRLYRPRLKQGLLAIWQETRIRQIKLKHQ